MTPPTSLASKAVAALGMPWESAYGYAQAVRAGNVVYVSGQLGHDATGRIAEGMETQMRLTYANARIVLEQLGATLDDVVEEVLYVTDMASAFAAAAPVREAAYGRSPLCASTIVQVTRLALPEQLIEVRFTAVVGAV